MRLTQGMFSVITRTNIDSLHQKLSTNTCMHQSLSTLVQNRAAIPSAPAVLRLPNLGAHPVLSSDLLQHLGEEGGDAELPLWNSPVALHDNVVLRTGIA